MDKRFIGNYHTHTCRCQHGGGSPIDYAAVAAEYGMRELGMSDHMPYDDDQYIYRMRMREFPLYLQDIQDAQKAFPKLKIYSGLECEYLPHKRAHLENLRSQLDYLVLGQHFFLDAQGKSWDTYKLGNSQLFIPYAESIRDAMATGLFACVAHPDLIGVHDYPADEYFVRAMTIILNAAEKYAVPIEINGNGIRKGCDWDFYHRNGESHHKDYQYPDARFFRMVAQRQLPCIINADAHSPKEMCGKHIDDAFAFSDALGLTVLERLPIR